MLLTYVCGTPLLQSVMLDLTIVSTIINDGVWLAF